MALVSADVPENEYTFILTWVDQVGQKSVGLDLIAAAYDYDDLLVCAVGSFNPRCNGVQMSRDHLKTYNKLDKEKSNANL